MMSIHHYVKTGFAGYGPDLNSEDETYDDMPSLCEGIRWELAQSAESLEQSAHIAAEDEDYETAWKSHALAVDLDTLAQNLDYDHRRNAPRYVNDTPALYATMERIIAEQFPLDVTPDGNVRLYVWHSQD